MQIIKSACMRKRSKHGEFRHVQIDFQQKINQLLYIIFVVIIEAHQNASFHGDAIVVIALDTVADKIGRIKNCLINKPCTSPRCQIQHLVVIFNGMTAKLLLQRNHFSE